MNKLIPVDGIKNRILELRGQKVILDKDIAQLYGVTVKRLNEQVKRNSERFPADFFFQLTDDEYGQCQKKTINMSVKRGKLRSQFATANLSMRRTLPYAFTRNGVNMLATVLRTKIAVQRSIFIMRAFSAIEEAVGASKRLISSPQVLKRLSVHSRAILRLFKETNVNNKQISLLKNLQGELVKLIQKIIIASIT